MTHDSKEIYTDKQKRRVEYVEQLEQKKDRPKKDTKRTRWATVNKQIKGEFQKKK